MRTCPSCGEENADRARFCSNCGTSLQEAAPPGAEERKTVSVLFVDLVGFTARSDDADPEDVRSTLRVYHDRLREEIERFGGTVEKFIGDAVMAVFGAPVAHEDDAERAVRAALRITEAIEELNAERPGLDLAVRGAVNTGEAVVALGAHPERGEGFVTGDVVNVASRLQGLAPVGGVVVGELTHRATDGPIEYEELAPVEVKGKEGAIPLWRVVGARSRFGVDIESGTATPLIGRRHELGLLQQLYRRAAGDRAVQLVTLSGEPGVGKSRMVREFRRFIDDEPDLIVWRQGRCLPYGEGITFWALGEVVKAHAGILENDDAEEAAGKLAAAVALVVEDDAEREWITARLRPLVGVDTDEGSAAADRDESFAAWRGFLEAIAATGPFVLVIEDLHWADPSLLAFVEHLADWANDVPLLILCTARPELYERHPAWGGGTRNHTAIALSPLSTEETAQLIGALLDQAVLPSETQSALMSRAGGNPLYAEEFVRMLIDRGVLVRRGAAWELPSGEDEIPVPESVHALIAARLDTLPVERKALLQDASVVGKVFWAGAVAEMGGLDPSAVRDGLHELARKELVRPARRPTIEGETEYAFWHVLIRDVAYGQIPRAARSAKHVAAAAWIERIAGERIEDSVELLVHHLEQAIALARSAGADADDLEEKLVPLLLIACERALRLDTVRAVGYFERAFALTRPGEPDRLRVLLAGTKLSTLGGDTGRERERERLALEEARAQRNRRAEAEVLSVMSRVAWAEGDTARQFALVEEAIAILQEFPPGKEYARALTRAASAYGLAGRTHDTVEWVARALPVVLEHGTEMDRAVLLQFGGEARAYLGEVEKGIADVREGLRIAREVGPVGQVCAAYVNLGDMVWGNEGPAQGQELYELGIEFGERRGAAQGVRWGRMQSMWTRFDLGRWDELLAIGADLIATEPDAGTQIAVLAETYREHVLVRRGGSDGSAFETHVLPRALEIGDDQVVIPALHVAALGRLARGGADGAVAAIEDLHERMTDRPGSRAWLLDEASDVCRVTGADGLLDALLGGLAPSLLRDRISVVASEAVLAELRGDPAAARVRYEEAAERWSAFPHVLQHGLAAMGAGRCSLELGRSNDAEERLRAARGVFLGLGATPLVTEVDGLLERATARSG